MLQALAEELPSGTIRFGSKLTSIADAPSGGGVRLVTEDGLELWCRVLVGADGVRSAATSHLKLPAPSYSGYVAYRGVVTMPEGVPVALDTIRMLWGRGVRAGLYALTPTTAYWYTCVNARESDALPQGADAIAAAALAPVAGWACGITDVIRATPPEAISRSRIADRWTWPLAFGSGGVTLAGDAAHPQTPNLGQGGCTALEDAVVLARALHQAGGVTGGTEEALQVIACPRLQHTL